MTKKAAETEIAVREGIKAPVKMNITNATLDKLKKKFSQVPDCTTAEGYELARVGIAEVVGLRTGLAACKKDKKAEAIAFNKNVDAEYNRILNILVSLETPYKEAKKKVDAIKEAEKEKKRKAEETRKFKITNRINMIREVVFVAANKSSEEIEKQLDVVKGIEINKADFEEFKVEAERARIDVEVKLEDLYAKAVEREEADKLRQIEEEHLAEERRKLEEDQAKEAAAREEREEKERKERELREAEEAKKRQIEEDKLEVEREELRKKKEEIDERERKADEAREAAAEETRLKEEKAEQEKAAKEAEKEDEELQAEKRSNTLETMLDPLYRDDMGGLLDAIIAGKIPHVTFG